MVQPRTRVGSFFLTGLTDEGFDTNTRPITQEELPMVRSEIKQTAQRIFDNWEALESIVQRHEPTIQKRWTNKPKMKRRELLLTTWPNMARDHRPDLVLDSKARSVNEIQMELYEGWKREALLMPYINLHDLTKTEPLLLMINARARRPPNAFSSRDLQLSTHRTGLTEWRTLEGYIMDFDRHQSGPGAYGQLLEGKWKYISNTMGADPRLAAGTIRVGDGLWILEIQDSIYRFLLDIVQRILHDIPAGDLTASKYKIQLEPPVLSANSREDGVVSLASTNLEAIYSSPGQMDLQRLQSLLAAKANEEEDRFWALREDPGRFSEELDEFIAHRPEYVLDLSGGQHPSITADGCEKRFGPGRREFKNECFIMFLAFGSSEVEFWVTLVREVTDLVRLKKQHFDGGNVESGDPLPEPFAMALYKSQDMLWNAVRQQVALLRTVAYSSPPIRPYMRRSTPDTLETFVANMDKWPPSHTIEFMIMLERFFHDDSMKARGHVAGLHSLMEQYDQFIDAVPLAQQAASSYVAKQISNLALLSECLRQIHLFQPWASNFHVEMAAPRVQAYLTRLFEDHAREIRPLRAFKPSARVLSMVAEVSKSPYPVHKKRTAANVEAMQHAETLLDRFWDAILTEMEQRNALPRYSKSVFFFQGRQVQRTPDWVEPVKPTKKTPSQVTPPEVLLQSFQALNVDDCKKVQDSPVEKSKIKTRGKAAPQISVSTKVQETQKGEQSPAHTIQVDRRALKVFTTLFHTPSSTSKPGEVPWADFIHAMCSAGFGVEKLYGSVWQFTPHDDSDSGTAAEMRGILFHEPHPHSRIPFWHARRHGRRLARTYGWSGETFVLK